MPRPPSLNPRHRCPDCNVPLAQLAERMGGKGTWAPYADPRDDVAIYRCKEHGPVAVFPDGRLAVLPPSTTTVPPGQRRRAA